MLLSAGLTYQGAMSDERTITLDAISRAMQAVGRSRLFRDFTEAEAHRTLKALQSGNKRSQTRVGAVLSASQWPNLC